MGSVRSVPWQLGSDVSRQPIGPIFIGQTIQEEFYFIPCLECGSV
jgi:hypothetical protein